MANKKAKYKYHDGSNLDVYHFETQPSQVKIFDSTGKVTSNLDELLLKGKVVAGVSLNTIGDTGLYMVKDCTDSPISMATGTGYLMSVENVGIIVKQMFFDRANSNTYTRAIYNGSVGTWIASGKITADTLNSLKTSVGNLGSLKTSAKDSLVSSINEVNSKTDSTAKAVSTVGSDLANLDSRFKSHNHDSVYLRKSGGSLEGTVSMAHDTSYAGKTASGNNLNIGKVNVNGAVSLGDSTASTLIQAKDGNVKVYDGSTTRKLYHEGNMGSGSGLDADKIDGLDSNQLARVDAFNNHFKGDQFIEESKSLVLKASSGSTQAGNIFFRDGDNNQKAKITARANGDLMMTAGSINGHTFEASGDLYSTYKHRMSADSRENQVVFERSGDAGIGLYMTTDGGFGMFDWQGREAVFGVDRASREVNFKNSIYVNGKKLTIQSTAPTNPKNGDIWFDI
ncbi:pyocin knob domain-containing protein [Priestia megaterium]|uniref:pyocin knob domain-containing protein n=1 Tax=Priestia megaterium TaxID=1404 RepID=UPI002E1CAF71|nr:pyocin knob domain-containing protein [Priestia megaterium]